MKYKMAILILVVIGLGQILPAKEGSDEERKDKLKCANLIYAGSKSSVCFSDKFLDAVRRETNCWPEKKFSKVRLSTEEMFQYPFAIMTGEGAFSLLETERRILKAYLTRGGFLLASAGCSSKKWDTSFRREIQRVFPNKEFKKVELGHPIFHTVFDVKQIKLKRGGSGTHLLGLEMEGKIVLIYSPEGLNDTAHAGKKCCCCGGNEIKNSQEINANIFTYALTH